MQSDELNKLFQQFTQLKALVVGDVMIDSYLYGKVERISPEAPVPVVHISKREKRAGGAANVAINIKAMGATPVLCAVTGDDEAGADLKRLLEADGMTAKGLMVAKGHKTTVKTRVIGNKHQLLRVDDEEIRDLAGVVEKDFIEKCLGLIDNEKPDVIIFEDYDKGVITPALIDAVTASAKRNNIPVTVDPKRKNFNAYRDVTLFKPNLHELATGLNLQKIIPENGSLTAAVQGLIKDRNISMVMVTLSEAGVFIATADRNLMLPAHVRNISDVSGAGDTVISVASLCVAAKQAPEVIAGLSNLAGGLVCEEVGVVPVNRMRLQEEAGHHFKDGKSINQ